MFKEQGVCQVQVMMSPRCHLLYLLYCNLL